MPHWTLQQCPSLASVSEQMLEDAEYAIILEMAQTIGDRENVEYRLDRLEALALFQTELKHREKTTE